MHERAEGECDQRELQHRAGGGEGHQAGIAAMRAEQRERCLHEGDGEGEGEREMPKFCNHLPPLRCHSPDFFSASTTSGGM